MSDSSALELSEVGPRPVLSPEDIRGALSRILDSPDFNVPDRAKRFLSYVVEEMLAGRGDRIKAYSIATEVFGRDSSFDAQSDPVVRIEAGKVRRALEHYYLTAGRNDKIIASIPKGGYLPQFQARSPAPDGAPPLDASEEPTSREAVTHVAVQPNILPRWAAVALTVLLSLVCLLAVALVALSLANRNLTVARVAASTEPRNHPAIPRVLVEQFEDLTGTPASAIIARGLTEEIIGRMAKFRELEVVKSVQLSGAQQAPALPRDSFVLEGSVRIEKSKLRLAARIVYGSTVVWANNYNYDLSVRAVLDMQDDIASRVASAVAQPHGVIFKTNVVKRPAKAPDDWAAYSCTLAYYSYRANFSSDAGERVIECLEKAVVRFPEYATAWALLSLMYIDKLRFRRDPNATPPSLVDWAALAARRAVDLDPENVRALHAQMMVLFFTNNPEGAMEVGAKAVAINPNDSELLGEYGVRMSTAGQWALGSELIAKAMDRNPAPSALLEASLALSLYMQRDYQKASTWIKRADVQLNPIYHLIAAAIYGQVGDAKRAERERVWIFENAPDLVANLPAEFAMRNMQVSDQVHFVDGLRKAGFSGLPM